MEARLTHIGAATLLLEPGGLRLLTDPAFDRVGTRHTVPRPVPGPFNSSRAERAIPIHCEGWLHFKQGRDAARRAFEAAGVADRVLWLEQGEPTEVGL